MVGRNYWYDAYRSMLQNRYSEALNVIQRTRLHGTHMSALRKIHETVATVCDRIMAIDFEGNKAGVEDAMADVAKAAVIVKYQRERRNIDTYFADALLSILVNDILRGIEKAISSTGHTAGEEIKKHASTLRLFLDAVIAYHYNAIRG